MKQFKQIESVEFAVNFSVINSLKIYLMALEENAILRQLIENLQKHPDNIQRVTERLVLVLNSEHNAEFMHPQDEAISAYLYVLSQSDRAVAVVASRQILALQNMWWAKKLAVLVLEGAKPTVEFTIYEENWSEAMSVEISFGENSNIDNVADRTKERQSLS